MRITFVGSSHGVPEPHRKATCIMVEVGRRIYFIDMGTSAIDALRARGLAIDDVQAVFITHMHGDHTDGLIPFVDLITWYFKTADPVICLPDLKAKEAIQAWLDVTLSGQCPLQFRQTREGLLYDDGVLQVTAIPTRHCPGSHAYLVQAEGKTVLFTGDLRDPAVDFPAVAKTVPLDLLVCEAAHFSALNYAPVLQACTVAKMCITHYSDRFLISALQLKEQLAEQGLPVTLATDDLQITV